VAAVAHDDGSVTLDYEAWSQDEGLQHAEAMRLCRVPDDSDRVVLMATSDGSDDTMTFREGEAGVFGSTGQDRVGLVLVPNDGRLGFSWWWPDENGVLSQQSRAELTLLRPLVPAPASLHSLVEAGGADDETDGGHDAQARQEPANSPEPHRHHSPATQHQGGDDQSDRDQSDRDQSDRDQSDRDQDDRDQDDGTVDEGKHAGQASPQVPEVPWPGIVVLSGNGTGVVAQRLAERLTRAAVVRTDLFDKAVRGSDAETVDPALRHRIAIAVTHGYARSGHPVILHGAATRVDHAQLVDELRTAGLTPVRLVDVLEGEDYGEVARRLIDGE
jgi:hypothetical protein